MIDLLVQAECGLQFATQLREAFWPWLYSQPMFQRSQGRDHFLMLSKTWGRAFECEPLSTWVQTKYMGHPRPGWQDFDWTGADNVQKVAHANSHQPDAGWKLNAHPMPYPSAVHYHDLSAAAGAELLESLQLSRTVNPWDVQSLWPNRRREYLASYVGTVWRGAHVDTKYWRTKVLCAEECFNSPDCLANTLDAPPQQPGTPRNAWAAYMPKHAHFPSFTRNSSGVDAWLVDRGIGSRFPQLTYLHSVFCLCPPGDGPTRKGIFDAILFGCIPVRSHFARVS